MTCILLTQEKNIKKPISVKMVSSGTHTLVFKKKKKIGARIVNYAELPYS